MSTTSPATPRAPWPRRRGLETLKGAPAPVTFFHAVRAPCRSIKACITDGIIVQHGPRRHIWNAGRARREPENTIIRMMKTYQVCHNFIILHTYTKNYIQNAKRHLFSGVFPGCRSEDFVKLIAKWTVFAKSFKLCSVMRKSARETRKIRFFRGKSTKEV